MKPFVKWAGGKRKLYPVLKELFPPTYKRYYEPFLGGGAVLFSLKPADAIVGDSNPNLIELYDVVKDSVEELILKLSTFQNTLLDYLEVRKLVPETKIERAARILYLNKTCFNGLYRENNSGQFNIPYGHHTNFNFEVDNLRAVSSYLISNQIQVKNEDWRKCISGVGVGDLVFLDPPYYPVKASSFTKYSQTSLNGTELESLVTEMKRLSDLGAYVIMTNSYCPAVLEAFKDFTIKEITGNWSVGAGSETRKKKITEVVVTTYVNV